MTTVVLKALQTSDFPSVLNHTFITLIPKKRVSENVVDFRSISLCNVVYKLISKVIANRLKKLLPDVVPDSLSAFVPG